MNLSMKQKQTHGPKEQTGGCQGNLSMKQKQTHGHREQTGGYQGNLSMKQKQTHGHREDWWLPRGRELGEGWSRRLGLADVSFYIQDG